MRLTVALQLFFTGAAFAQYNYGVSPYFFISCTDNFAFTMMKC